GWFGVLGSSLTLSMAQLAPAILSTRKTFSQTVVEAIDTLGKRWRQGLIIKISMYVIFAIIVVLPKLIQAGFFEGPRASQIGWTASLIVGASGYVFFKVLNSIFTTTLYYQARHSKK
ncbi:hypothetical protein HY380_00150, partial [Candidatus Saccharibacteria bacterium]|nr:hypothetical protein [Candidatus Saccharibacteria bacterium]